MEKEKTIFDVIADKIKYSRLPKEEKDAMLARFNALREEKLSIMITGATGCGKSSTINALFGREIAEVGYGVDPKTEEPKSYDIGNVTLWDNPGLGDSAEADKRNAEMIANMLKETDENNRHIIDLVLVVINGSNRDMGTSYELINNVVVPNLGDDAKSRIMVAINQADVAMGGRHWNAKSNQPDSQLLEFLDQKVASVKQRIADSTGVEVQPIYYAAGFKEEGKEQAAPYNIDKLTRYIIESIPADKRLSLADNIPVNPTKTPESNGSFNDMMKNLEDILNQF